MTDRELSDLEVVAKAAKAGPMYGNENIQFVENRGGSVFGAYPDEEELRFITAANPAVILRLIAELRKEKQRCAQLTKERIYLAKCLEYNNSPDMRVSYYEYIARAKKFCHNAES